MTGTGALIRLALRRDRVLLPLWVLLLGFLPVGTVSTYEGLYPDAASRTTLNASSGDNPSIAVIYGKAFDLTTPGGFTAWRYGVFLALFLGLVAAFTVTRHTRAEEDSGRLELLGSAVVGRYAALTAAVAVAAGTSAVVGAVQAVTLIGAGLPAAGSLTFGAGMAGAGLAFTAVAAVTAQLTEYSRSANGLAGGVLGVAFLLRAVGDSSPGASWLSWLSPLSWTQLARPFAGERPWVLFIPLVAAVVVGTGGYLLLPRRDLGAGLLPMRPGPPTAPPSLRGPLGLAWRLQRGALIGWTVAMAVIGAVFGSIADGIGGLVGDSEQVRGIFERMGGAQGIVDTYLALIGSVFGMVVAVYAVLVALRLRTEETGGRAEPVLAAGVGRTAWMGAHLVFALLGSALLLTVAGLGAGLAHGLRAGDLGTQLGHAVGGAIAQLPAVWVVAGVAALLFGLLPTLSAAGSWAVVGVVVGIGLFGPALNAGQAVLDVSPFTHVPKVPGPAVSAAPLVWLTAIGVFTAAAGLAAFRRRDVG
ncbi:putative ABC transporter membrane protein [Actinokineospora spheciospongiae]|uniref:Putative ABC transporter membrane protein n=1 Tax=Actinokineospora spheciospongiae TaxID=909613 RepID=W7INZ2_9PSEU|nr:ABC transporter permease [Actinokineospora spheciospongiae]EWC62093.1 putative ABC transporter membrane protein [Actinokineospora spheciospongiae]